MALAVGATGCRHRLFSSQDHVALVILHRMYHSIYAREEGWRQGKERIVAGGGGGGIAWAADNETMTQCSGRIAATPRAGLGGRPGPLSARGEFSPWRRGT